MLKSIFSNARKPRNSATGRIMLRMMNFFHNNMSLWALSKVVVTPEDTVLDIGCGGGRNISNMLKRAGKVYGIDYSCASVEKSRKVNSVAVAEHRCDVILANVEDIPFDDCSFDLITAFETVYFWPDMPKAFKDIYALLKPDGIFLVCNELVSSKEGDFWSKIIDMNIYTPVQISGFMKDAGFCEVVVYERKAGSQICITGRKNHSCCR